MEEARFQRLRQFLTELSPGPVPAETEPELVQLLEDCWGMFSGSTEEAMEAYKLSRMEEPEWNTPVLAFITTRHGGTALGSTRAEKQCWYVDLDRLEAERQVIGYRQLYPRQAPSYVEPIADELAKLIISGSQDERLQWSSAGRLQIHTGKILLSDISPKRTLEGRRKRFNKALEERLTPYGWRRYGSWWERKE